MIGFAISIFCLKLSQKDASKELTYGWHRSEIIGTLVSIIFLVTVTLYLLKEAVNRVLNPPELES
jgi:Co/Zn/Cd efflux system component